MRWFLLVTAVVTLLPGVAPSQDKLWRPPQDVSLLQLGTKFRLIGKLGQPLGEVVAVEGVVVEGPFKGYEGGPNLRVQRINSKATQEDVQIALSPYFLDFGEGDLPKLENGKTYAFEGYESGKFVGIPAEAYRRADLVLQTTGFYFHHRYIVYKATPIKPVAWSPADFIDREALLEGTAVSRDNKAYIDGPSWQLLTSTKAWPKPFEGKTVEALGMVKKSDADGFQLASGTTRLVKLADQLGRRVELRGRAWSVNDHWWYEYRGTKLYVEDLENLPGWKTAGARGDPIVITGILDEAELPDLDQITLKQDRDLRKYFIVRKAAWKRVDALLSPERVD